MVEEYVRVGILAAIELGPEYCGKPDSCHGLCPFGIAFRCSLAFSSSQDPARVASSRNEFGQGLSRLVQLPIEGGRYQPIPLFSVEFGGCLYRHGRINVCDERFSESRMKFVVEINNDSSLHACLLEEKMFDKGEEDLFGIAYIWPVFY